MKAPSFGGSIAQPLGRRRSEQRCAAGAHPPIGGTIYMRPRICSDSARMDMNRNDAYRYVLIIEDDDDIREALSLLLQDEGYAVHAAQNGAEGLEIMSSETAPPRVILLDLMMPVMNGWEFLATRRQDPQLARVPVVVVSATGNPTQLGGATAFLRKPVDMQRLLEVVHQYTAS
jgi:CheY-like chemotaxis protein